jgi:hypothetical protein
LAPLEAVQTWLLGQHPNPTHSCPTGRQVPPAHTRALGQQVLNPTQVDPLSQQKPTREPQAVVMPMPHSWPLEQQVPLRVQFSLDAHAPHAAPPAPQVELHWESYGTQLPLLSQQPLGQVVAVQVGTQLPLWHA